MGITLFEMLTGRVPFNGETTVAIAIKHIQEEMPSPRDYVPEIPLCVEQIVLKCTQKSPDRRYLSMAALIEDLKRALMSPDEDFVQMDEPDENMATRAVTDKERSEIKKQSKKKEIHEEEMRLKKNTSTTTKKKKAPVYEEEEEDEDSRMERLTTILAIVGAVLIGCAVIFLVGRTIGIFDFAQQSEQVKMIDVSGMDEKEALEKLKKMGLKTEVEYVLDDTVEAGKVISADVQAGAIVSGGTKVILTVCGTGDIKNGIPVPSVEGFLEADATATLKKSGFEVNKLSGYSDTVEKGKVMGQSPAGQSTAEAGTTINIVISQGPNTDNKVLMPDVIGLDPLDAIAILTESGLLVGEQRDMNDANTDLIGKVCYASYSVGAPVEPGTTIDIGISIGPEEMTYYFNEAILSPADLDPDYKEGTECKITLTGQSGAEYTSTTVRTFPYTSVNLRNVKDPAGLITYEFTVEEPAHNEVNANGETVAVPGQKTQRIVQRTVFFTPEG